MEMKVKKYIADSIKEYLLENRHQDVVIEFMINSKSGTKKTTIKKVEDGIKYFLDNKFSENGLKSFVKHTKSSEKHGYVIFETKRIPNLVDMVEEDLKNINIDLNNKREH